MNRILCRRGIECLETMSWTQLLFDPTLTARAGWSRPANGGLLEMPTSRTVGLGLVALGAAIAALLPVFLVIYPGAGVGQGDATHPDVILPIVARNPALVIGPGIVEAFGHAIGAVAILGFWLRSGQRSFLLTAATL